MYLVVAKPTWRPLMQGIVQSFPHVLTRKMFLLTKTKHPKKVHCNIIYSRKRFLKIKTCSAERRSES